MCRLQHINILGHAFANNLIEDFQISYQVFGVTLHSAPIVLVNHALTGNSNVAGKNGWWNRLVGEGKSIDLNRYTVIAFNIPGNGYQKPSPSFLSDYKLLTTKSIAEIFWKALKALNIHQLYAVIGGSLGGAIAWEMAVLRPTAITHLIPIATSIQASDWLIANVLVQECLLNQSEHPIENARMHAMLLYRTPESIQQKFKKTYRKKEAQFEVESWLKYHGNALNERFSLEAYKQMNYLLRTIGADLSQFELEVFAKQCTAYIHCIAINSDYMFTRTEQKNTYQQIKKYHSTIDFYEIESIHGHDAFLIEYEQLNHLLNNIF